MSAVGVFRETSREQSDLSLFLGSGPLSLVCSCSLAFQRSGNFDLLVPVLLGSLLCLKMRMRGLLFSLLLLLAGALAKHLFFLDDHLWRFGIESSIGLGLLISAMASDLLYKQKEGLCTQAESQGQTVRNLEEELSQVRREAQEEQITLRDRLAALQTEFDEASGDLSALQILNEVLRKTSAKQSKEQEALQQQIANLHETIQDREHQIAQLEHLRQLHLQLKNQFEEKNQILHLTRRELFATETRLQRAELEQEEKKFLPSFSPLEQELIALEQERSSLETENQELTELVTLLSSDVIPKKRKREKKTEEDLLF